MADALDPAIRTPPALRRFEPPRSFLARTAHRLLGGAFERGFRFLEIKSSSHVVHPRS